MRLLLLATLVLMTAPARAGGNITIDDPEQVEALTAVQTRLDAVSTALMTCIEGGKAHKACLCEAKELVLQFNASVDDLFSAHPELARHDLVNFRNPAGLTITHSLRSLAAQAAEEPPCP